MDDEKKIQFIQDEIVIIVLEENKKMMMMKIEFVIKIVNEMNMQQNLKKKLNKII